MRAIVIVALGFALTAGAEDYRGPRPEKADVPYLVHASNLIATDAGTAKQEGKNSDTYSVEGPAAKVRTPLAEPIFLLRSEKLRADSLELYKLSVKGAKREVTLKKKRTEYGPFHLQVTKLDRDLYRIEADEPLENGQYSLSPTGSDVVFCFEIY